jgi:hypothetical protein
VWFWWASVVFGRASRVFGYAADRLGFFKVPALVLGLGGAPQSGS